MQQHAHQSLFIVALFVGVLCVCTGAAWAVPIQAGPYVVDADVRNSANMLVPNVKPHARVVGNQIVVTASALGFDKGEARVPVASNSYYYKCDVYLGDGNRELVAVDQNRRKLTSVYFRRDQFGFKPDEFGITAFIPVVDWPNPGEKRVNVFDPTGFFGWSVPLARSAQHEVVDGFYRVRLAISRKAHGLSGSMLVVMFDNRKPAESVSDEQAATMLAELARLELAVAANPAGFEPGVVGEATLQAASQIRPEFLQGRELPGCMKAYVAQRATFEALHDPAALRR